ncbi:MAG: hypothetical protein ACLPY1_17440 [Terracidiphilus sp.]
MEEVGSTSEDRLGLLSDALHDAVAVFRKLDDEGRARLLKTLSTLFGITHLPEASNGPRTVSYGEPADRFSKEQSLSPKEFILKKQPRSDVERVACLAYYLAHYRDQPHFKTFDISQINTEAAQTKLSNPAQTVINATNYGYLAPAIKGMKQLSAAGEMYVEALPDREAASAALANSRPKRQTKKAPARKRTLD